MKTTYKTRGTCSSAIEIETDGDTIVSVRFNGGCNGNGKGLSNLLKGMKIDDVIDKLSGVTCGMRKTSCPDQLARALIELRDQQ